jgi:hypothetical protein
LGPRKASEKTPKGVIPSSLFKISQNASRKKRLHMLLIDNLTAAIQSRVHG